MKAFFRSNRKTILLVSGVVVIGGLISGYVLLNRVDEVETDQPAMQTATIRSGDLVLRASGTGTVISNEAYSLGFGTQGVVADILVTVGQQVEAGDVLAVQADQDELELAVATAELAVIEAQQAYDQMFDEADLVTAQALLALSEAEDALTSAEYTWTVQQEGNRASAETLAAAEASLVLAEENLERAEADFNAVASLPEDNARRANALIRLASARSSYNSALRTLNWYTGHPTETQQMALDADVAIAQANLEIAQQAYERVAEGPDPTSLAEAEIKLRMAEADLEVAQSNLDQATITAPIDGTIISISASIGDSVAQSFIELADLSHPLVEFFLDETDLDKAEIGNAVEVVFDAYPDYVLDGVVISVSPQLSTFGNVSTVYGEATIELTGSPLAMLPLGMSGAVDVIAGEAEDAVLVPVEALREISDGVYGVFVLVDGEPELHPVEIGLMDYTYAEVTDGLSVGDVVTTGIMDVE